MRPSASTGADIYLSAPFVNNIFAGKTEDKSELALKIAGVGSNVASLSWKQLDIQESDQRGRMSIDCHLPRLGVTRSANELSAMQFSEYFMEQKKVFHAHKHGKLQIVAIDERLI